MNFESRVYNFRAPTERRITRESSGNAASRAKKRRGSILIFLFRRNIFFIPPFFLSFKYFPGVVYPPLAAIEKISCGRKNGWKPFRRVGRSTDESAHLSDSVLHTLFAASGARARVTSVGREEGDINFCRDRCFYAPSLCARHPRFDGCSFVVRSLNAGAGKERSIFNLRLHAKREERKSTNDALCDTHTHTYARSTRLYGDATAAITLGIPLERDGAKKKKVCCCMLLLSDCSTNRKVYAL